MSIENVINTEGFQLDREKYTEYYNKNNPGIEDISIQYVQEGDDEYWEFWETGEGFDTLDDVILQLKIRINKNGNELKDFGYYLTGTCRLWEISYNDDYGITITKDTYTDGRKQSYEVSIYQSGNLINYKILNSEIEVWAFLMDMFE